MNYTDKDIHAIVDTQVELKTKELQTRIDKAIEKISKYIIDENGTKKNYNEKIARETLNILKGDDE